MGDADEVGDAVVVALELDFEAAVPDHLTLDEQMNLLNLLQDFKDVFETLTQRDGVLGTMPMPPVEIDLLPDARPYHGRPYPVPQSHLASFKEEVNRLVRIGVLRPCNDSPWGSPSFGTPKPDGTMRFVTDLRPVNQRTVRKPFPIPRIDDIFHTLDGITHASALDFSMAFYHVPLSAKAQNIFTTVLPWGKFAYQRLPMGYQGSPDIFQYAMQTMFGDIEGVIIYIDDILLITKGTFDEHIALLRKVLDRCRTSKLLVNLRKSKFFGDEFAYLGFILSPDGLRPDPKKVEAISKLESPKTKKQLQSFLGMVNYIRNSIPHYGKYTAKLSNLVGSKTPFEWNEEYQQAFDGLKKQVMKATMLSYPDYSSPFEVYTDASKTQVGSVIIQKNAEGKLKPPIAFFSKKLAGAALNYTVTELELMAIVLTLKSFKTLLYGQDITIFTDHKNLTFERFGSERVRRWRLFVEEFGPDIIYLPGHQNVVADALSRLPYNQNSQVENEIKIQNEVYGIDECPIDFHFLMTQQRKHLPSGFLKYTKLFGDEYLAVTENDQIRIPKVIANIIMEWYHDLLVHPGPHRMYKTMMTHFHWPRMEADIKRFCRTCDKCQRFKRTRQHYGAIPKANPETKPWNGLCVDLIGPYSIPRNIQNNQLSCLTMIDPATKWIEIARIFSKDAENVALTLDRTWFSRYPRPSYCLHDNGNEFLGNEFQELLRSYGIESKPTTVKNPQANAVLERTHQTIADMLRSYNLTDRGLREVTDDEIDGILNNICFALRSTFHTGVGATPAQLIFGRDMLFPTKFVANWKQIREKKQARMTNDNRRENKKRYNHNYQVGDLVLI